MLTRLLRPHTRSLIRTLATMSTNQPERLKELNTVYMSVTPEEERAVMIRVLQDSFKRTTLDGLPFFQALQSGAEVETGVGYEGCVDRRIVSMINSYPVAQKRERLLSVFTKYQDGQKVTDPFDQMEQQETHTESPPLKRADVSLKNVNRPGIPKLSDIVTDLETHSCSKTLLNQITQSRLNTLTQYLSELQVTTAKHHPRLQNPSTFANLTQLLTLVNDQSNALMSIDIEAYEFNQETVTEIGISLYDPCQEATSIFPNFKNIHLLPEEHIRLRNGSFVADNKDKFLGGNSIIIPQKGAVQLVQCLVDYYFVHRTAMGMQGVLVGHNVGGDVKWLTKLGVEFPTDMKIMDTQTLYELTHGQNNSSLGGILRRYDIPHAYLHNAANDAYYTLMLAMKMADPPFRRVKGVDSFKEGELYQEKLEQRKNVKGDAFKGSRASRPRSAKATKNNETLAPLKFNTFTSALGEVFKPAGGLI